MRPLQWAALALAGLFAAFFILFAFSTLPLKWGFAIMLIPAALVLGVLLLGLHRPLWGALAFALLGVVAFFFYASYRSLVQFLLVDFPFFAVAALLFIDYWKKERS